MSNPSTTLPKADDTFQLNDVELRTPTLITEQQVRFSTAAALSAPTRRTRNAGFVAAMRRLFAVSPESTRPERRHHARRYTFLENALMAREMDRL